VKRSSIVANLVIGADGSFAPSREITVSEDRVRFHQIRAGAGLIAIGGETARHEPYDRIKQPLLIITRQPIDTFNQDLLENENIRIVINQQDASLPAIIVRESERLWRQYQGHKYLLIEGGPHFISELISANLLDTLFLTRSPKSGSSKKLKPRQLESMLEPGTLIDQYWVDLDDIPGGGEAAFEEYEYWRGEGI